ncbi:MAG: hypothetical protein ISS23_00810 [Nanoarchaeota archaeon]|nr:hypothetical protein [Nanoarchaeota archaeon]
MKTKGQIWVSAVLYIALGMIVITMILSVGVPLVNKMRDRNTIAQTKRVMFDIDDNIKAVVNEAKGSARFLSPVDINAGKLIINEEEDKIEWNLVTKNKMIENDTEFTEGDLYLSLKETGIAEEYNIQLYLDYSEQNVNLSLEGDYQNPFQGRFSFSIKNSGTTTCNGAECPGISIMVT